MAQQTTEVIPRKVQKQNHHKRGAAIRKMEGARGQEIRKSGMQRRPLGKKPTNNKEMLRGQGKGGKGEETGKEKGWTAKGNIVTRRQNYGKKE